MFKPCTTKTSIVNRSFDEMGNLLWQQEAAEFVERYPQRRRPQSAALLLRQSASAGTLYRKPETVIPTSNQRASGGELLTPQHRHQRDLFSGDLGIPDINSHVGSMVHTFENMALQKQMAEKQRQQRELEHSKYFAELLAMQAATEAAAATNTTKRSTCIPTCGTSNSKFQQLKKKTHETRQKIIQQILQNHPLHKEVTKIPCTARQVGGGGTLQASSNTEVYYRNIGEDYRKNLFGSLTNRKNNSENPLPKMSYHTEVETSSFCDEIVAQAFDEIFEGYSGLDDDEDVEVMVDIKTDSLRPDFTNTSSFLQQYGRPGLTPKKLPPLTVLKKAAPPPPPPFALSYSENPRKRKIRPFSENKQKSTTFHNLLERLKVGPAQARSSIKLNKNYSDTLLNANQFSSSNTSKLQHKFPSQSHLNRQVEGQESSENLDHDFLRGSTVSQSFVRHLKVRKHTKGKAPPVPVLETESAKRNLKTSEALRQVLLFSKKSKSSGQLLPDDYTTVETRKYYRRLDDNDRQRQHSSSERIIDGCSGLASNNVMQRQEAEL